MAGGDQGSTSGQKSRMPPRKDGRPISEGGRGVFIPNFIGKVTDNYVFLRKMGHGSFGTVYEAVPKQRDKKKNPICARPTEMHVAIKVFDINGPPDQKPGWRDRIIAMFQAEVEIGRRCDHPNLVKLYETFEHLDEKGDLTEMAAVMELCEGGDLLDVVVAHPKGIQLDIARHICWQITCGLRHMHTRGFIHRDIKLENMFFMKALDNQNWQKAVLKLGDFGSVIRLNGPIVKSRGGSPSYLPPEVWRAQGWDPKGDCWALGVVSYAICVGSMPFPQPAHVGTNTTMNLVTKGEANYTRSSWAALPSEAKHFIQKLLKVKMSERSSIKEALQSPFLQAHQTDRTWAAWQVDASVAAWSRLDRFAQLLLQAIATCVRDMDVPAASWLFRFLDRKQGCGYLGTAREIANRIRDGTTDATEFEALEGVSYTGLLAVMLARPDIWFRSTNLGPKFHQYSRAVLRCLGSGEDAHLTVSDLNVWFPPADRWSSASTSASDNSGGEEGQKGNNDTEDPLLPHARKVSIDENAIERVLDVMCGGALQQMNV